LHRLGFVYFIGGENVNPLVKADHLLMATDYSHFDSEYLHTLSKIKERNNLTNIQKEKTLGENARQM